MRFTVNVCIGLVNVPLDAFDQDETLVSPAEARSRRVDYLEKIMRDFTDGEGILPARYHLFPGALLYDLQMVWRQRSRSNLDARYKSLFERLYADRNTTIAEKTFRNWTNGTSQIDRKRARAFLQIFLENWFEPGKALCLCNVEELDGKEPCQKSCSKLPQCCENVISKIFVFDGRPQDHISILPSPGYSAETVLKFYSGVGCSILFPVDTAHAHSWDEEHFFNSFAVVESFIRSRNKDKKPRFVYVIKPYSLTLTDAKSRQRATGEALYRAALERMVRVNRDIGRSEISDTVKFLVKTDNHHTSSADDIPEDLIMPARLVESLPQQSKAKTAANDIAHYIKKQMHIHGPKDYQYLAVQSANNKQELTYYLTCIPERREEGKWIARRYPHFPLRALIPGLDDPLRKFFAVSAESGGTGTILGWRALGLEEFLALPSHRPFNN